MNEPFQARENQNPAQDYYPKAMTLGKKEEPQIKEEVQQSPSSPFSNLFSQDNPLAQLLGGNSLLASLFSGNFNQNEMLSKLMSSMMKKSEPKDEKEKVIDISNSVEEL